MVGAWKDLFLLSCAFTTANEQINLVSLGNYIIPWNLFQKFDSDAIKKLVDAGFHPNQFENGMHLPQKIKSKNGAGDVVEHTFHGKHPAYEDYVNKILKEKSDIYGNNIQSFHNSVIDELIPALREKISYAENLIKTNSSWSGKTLNDYFKTLN